MVVAGSITARDCAPSEPGDPEEGKHEPDQARYDPDPGDYEEEDDSEQDERYPDTDHRFGLSWAGKRKPSWRRD